MLKDPRAIQDRLNAMILTPEEVEAFKAQRAQHVTTNMMLLAQGKFEAAREASLNLLKALFIAEEEYQMPQIEEHVLVHHFGFAAKRQSVH